MQLTPGSKLSHFEILAPLGAGGMGEVYRALDTTLRREVAIKLLPAEFASDPERIARFKREAQLLAALNHPNIATIHGLHNDGQQYFLVMELVAGEDLQQRIQRDGAVPLDESLAIATQICDALEHAHEKSVIHRDLKPANVKLTPEGKVKVLDFGLAKAFAGDGAGAKEASPGQGGYYLDSQSPTLAPQLQSSPTIPGAILGSAAYMSPEQARGKEVDKRTDIWALGCVLYELLTGQQAFTGETVPDILGAVMRAEPDWLLLPAATPPGVCALLRRCLQKDKTKRLASATDISLLVQDAALAPSAADQQALTGGARPSPSMARWKQLLPWGLAAVLAALLGVVSATNLVKTPTASGTPRVTRLKLALKADERILAMGTLGSVELAVSPNNDSILYVVTQGQDRRLFMRRMDSFEGSPIPGTEGANNPFFSPDGQWIGFFANSKLKKVAASGGAPVIITDASFQGLGASWGPDNTIVFTESNQTGLLQVSADGGAPKPVTTLDARAGEISHRWPNVLPNGKAVLFVATNSPNWDQGEISVQLLGSTERRVLLKGGTYPRYLTTGHIAYMSGNTLMVVPFDLDRMQVSGTPTPVVSDVLLSYEGSGEFSVSSQGTLAYIQGGAGDGRKLVWVSRKGEEEIIPGPPRSYDTPRISPNGQQIAFTDRRPFQVMIHDLPSGRQARITSDDFATQFPVWTPDGKKIVYRLTKEGHRAIYWKPVDGSAEAEQLSSDGAVPTAGSITPDGLTLIMNGTFPATNSDLIAIPLNGDHKPRKIISGRANETSAVISPDGNFLAYVSNESGQSEVYVQPFPTLNGRWQISTDGGQEPIWSPKGGEIFYRTGDKVMAVKVTPQPAFQAGTPEMLFESRYASRDSPRSYDVSPDGQRFLMVKPDPEESGATQINVVLNWFEELKQQVPVGRQD